MKILLFFSLLFNALAIGAAIYRIFIRKPETSMRMTEDGYINWKHGEVSIMDGHGFYNIKYTFEKENPHVPPKLEIEHMRGYMEIVRNGKRVDE